jgi:hypothetical protein
VGCQDSREPPSYGLAADAVAAAKDGGVLRLVEMAVTWLHPRQFGGLPSDHISEPADSVVARTLSKPRRSRPYQANFATAALLLHSRALRSTGDPGHQLAIPVISGCGVGCRAADLGMPSIIHSGVP